MSNILGGNIDKRLPQKGAKGFQSYVEGIMAEPINLGNLKAAVKSHDFNEAQKILSCL